jgi:DMSO/TMAO reductase YedYZ heme-binding membrane subunit
VFALWGLLLITVTSLLQRRLSHAAWRAVHGLAFGTMLLALVHSVVAGTDTGHPLVRALYAITAAVLVGTIAGRATVAALGSSRARAVAGQ